MVTVAMPKTTQATRSHDVLVFPPPPPITTTTTSSSPFKLNSSPLLHDRNGYKTKTVF